MVTDVDNRMALLAPIAAIWRHLMAPIGDYFQIAILRTAKTENVVLAPFGAIRQMALNWRKFGANLVPFGAKWRYIGANYGANLTPIGAIFWRQIVLNWRHLAPIKIAPI